MVSTKIGGGRGFGRSRQRGSRRDTRTSSAPNSESVPVASDALTQRIKDEKDIERSCRSLITQIENFLSGDAGSIEQLVADIQDSVSFLESKAASRVVPPRDKKRIPLTAKKLEYIALDYVGFDKERQKVRDEENVARFIEFFGVPPATALPFLTDLKKKCPEVGLKESLMTMNWFTIYDTERVLSARWRYGCTKYIRNTLKDYAVKMASMEVDKIRFDEFAEKQNLRCQRGRRSL